MKNYILLLIVSICAGCEYTDNRLKVINQASFNIAVYDTNDTSSVTLNNIEYYQSNAIHPKDTLFLSIPGKNGWVNYIEQGPQKKLYVFFFYLDTLNRYQHKADMNYLIESKRYIKRVTFTLNQLEKMNWEIQYFKREF